MKLKFAFYAILFSALVALAVLQIRIWTRPARVIPQTTAINPVIIHLSGPSFSATVRITTQEENIMLGTWYLAPFKPPAENYIDIKTVDGKTLHVGRSQVREMVSTAE